MNEIQRPRFNEAIRLLFGTLGADAPAPFIGQELVPVYNVNDFLDDTIPYLRGERICSGFTAQGAPGAGNFAKSSLANPVGSGILIVLERTTWWSDVPGDIWWVLINTVPAGTLGTKMRRDPRGPSTVPVGAVTFAADAVNPATVPVGVMRQDQVIGASLGNNPRVFSEHLVIPPGWSSRLGHATVATPSLRVGYEWRERVQSELEV